jgi:predicted nucleic acid-binding protein
MEQLVKSEMEQGELSDQGRPLVFLNTEVIVGYLQGDPLAAQLFSAEAAGRIRFAVNPIILQQLILGGAARQPEFEHIVDHLKVLPLVLAKAEALLPRARTLKRMPHTHDILIASSADECDFLVTTDGRLKNLITTGKPRVVTPEEFAMQLQAA